MYLFSRLNLAQRSRKGKLQLDKWFVQAADLPIQRLLPTDSQQQSERSVVYLGFN